MAIQQEDPFAKYAVQKSKPKEDDPFAKYTVDKTEETRNSTENIEEPKIEENEENKGIWEWLTGSILPEKLYSGDEPTDYWSGFAKGATDSIYEDVVRPMGSPLGAGLTLFGGPLVRAGVKGASLIPGMSKVGQLLKSKILPGEAPEFVKKAVESLIPKGSSKSKIPQNVLDDSVKIQEPLPPTPEYTPSGAPDWSNDIVPEVALPQQELKPVDKLLEAVRTAKPLEEKQARIYSAERGSRISEAEKVKTPGQAGFYERKSKLAGEHSKVQMEPLKLEQPDIDSLYNDINSSALEPYQRINAGDGLTKILNGQVPQNSEIQLLAKIFGEDKISELASRIPKIKRGDLIHEALNVPRAMQTIFDLSMPLRQGRGLILSRDWWKAWPAMVKSAGSEGAYKGVMDSILSKPNYKTKILADGTKEVPFFRRAGLHLTDLTDLTSREESMMSNIVEKVVPGARASNRAATAYINKLRSDHFDRLISAAEKAGLDPYENLDLAQKLANFVNTATGRGSLGPAEKYAVALNDVLFSPRFMASRINMLNPTNYLRLNTPEGRMITKQYWKSLAGLSAIWMAEMSLGQANGAEVSDDLTSSDFGKIKWGDVAHDPGGGFQQYLVLLARLAQQSYKTASGNERQYGRGFGSKTMFDAVEDFVVNKLAPVPKFFVDMARASEYAPFDVNDRTVRMLVPMIVQDLSELAQEDPSLLPLLGGVFFGESIQVNDPDIKMFGDSIPSLNIPTERRRR